MHKSYIFAALTAVSTIALTIGSAAYAQDSQATAAENARTDFGVDDIIVTAQRRQERNQDVPIAITAFSNERLDELNIASSQDLSGMVPSLSVSAAGQASRDVQAFTLRGMAPTYQGGASVIMYFNEVPLPQAFSISQQGGPGNFFDLENLQVLAGPQGTLFGRNTTGGAALIVPQRPKDEFEAYLEAGLGNYDYRGVEGVVNIPLVADKLAVRVAGTFQDRDGFTQDIVWNKDRDDMHYYAGRIGILAKPTETIENYLLIYGSKSSTNGSSYVHRAWNYEALRSIGQCVDACEVHARQTELQDALGPRKIRNGVDALDWTETWGVINKTSISLSDALTLNNIFSYQRFKKDVAYDADGTPLQQTDFASDRFPTFPVDGLTDEFGYAPDGYLNTPRIGVRDDSKQLTNELQLQGEFLDGNLNFSVGGFYFRQTPTGPQAIQSINACLPANTGQCGPTIQTYGVTSTSKALYAQATLDMGQFFDALDSLRVTAGYRYTWNKLVGDTTFYLPVEGGSFCIADFSFALNPADCRFEATLKSKAPTWTIGLDYKPSSNILLFAKVNRGYKSGGFNPYAVREETRLFYPEYVTNYEAGLKSDWRIGDMSVRLNMTAYHMDYQDIQRAIGDVNVQTGSQGAETIQADARIRGIETDLTIQPVRGLELSGSVSHTDGKWKRFIYDVQMPTMGCDGLIPPGGTVDRTCSNYPVSRWTYNLRASYELPTPDSWGKVSLHANYASVSNLDQTFLPSGADINRYQPGSVIKGYGLLNLSVRWANVAESGFDLEIFGTNVTNKLYRVATSNYFEGGYWAEMFGAPRMYGARLRYNFR